LREEAPGIEERNVDEDFDSRNSLDRKSFRKEKRKEGKKEGRKEGKRDVSQFASNFDNLSLSPS
jgi:hypothetical protein